MNMGYSRLSVAHNRHIVPTPPEIADGTAYGSPHSAKVHSRLRSLGLYELHHLDRASESVHLLGTGTPRQADGKGHVRARSRWWGDLPMRRDPPAVERMALSLRS